MKVSGLLLATTILLGGGGGGFSPRPAATLVEAQSVEKSVEIYGVIADQTDLKKAFRANCTAALLGAFPEVVDPTPPSCTEFDFYKDKEDKAKCPCKKRDSPISNKKYTCFNVTVTGMDANDFVPTAFLASLRSIDVSSTVTDDLHFDLDSVAESDTCKGDDSDDPGGKDDSDDMTCDDMFDACTKDKDENACTDYLQERCSNDCKSAGNSCLENLGKVITHGKWYRIVHPSELHSVIAAYARAQE